MKDISDLNELKNIGLFAEGEYLVFGFKKTEKIVSALYLVTSLIKDNEPLKWEVRDEALELLSLMMNLNSTTETQKSGALQSFFLVSQKLKSLLNVGDNSGLISSMNSQLIFHEIDLLMEFLRAHSLQSMSKAGYILSDTFFSTDMKAPEVGLDSSGVSLTKRQHSFSPEANKTLRTEPPLKDKKDSRQTAIIELLKVKSDLTIKDFVKVITDCSEKTIQRELIELMEKGTVIKRGERRWSTYSLRA